MNIDIDKVILDLFVLRWTGCKTLESIDAMRRQLHKNLQDQCDGYWSGHTAYSIMIDGGFLIGGKSGAKKDLTAIGKIFMDSMEPQIKQDEG